MTESDSLPLQQIRSFINQHRVGEACTNSEPLTGEFSLLRGAEESDLYGMVDAVYSLYTLGDFPTRTTRASRTLWANKILACQDDAGWFSRRNLRGHSKEHATAYAIGALHLLAVDADEEYVSQLKPLHALLPLLTNQTTFSQWIKVLDFRLAPRSILQKKLGWHYIWRGSHVGGGIPAAIWMTQHLFGQWWSQRIVAGRWFHDYLTWLDEHVSPNTGYWQRAFWNLVYRRPTLIDLGGAVHFFWIYEAVGHPFSYPEAVVASTLSLQQDSGLYKDHPFCIDLDGNFTLIRAYLQLPADQQSRYRERVYQAIERNFAAIAHALSEKPLEEIYGDSHGLPGALAALVECTKLPDFKYADAMLGWQHPLDKVCWL